MRNFTLTLCISAMFLWACTANATLAELRKAETPVTSPSNPVVSYNRCPDISDVTTLSLRETSGDKEEAPKEAPFVLAVPSAYLDEGGRLLSKRNEQHSISIYASYATLRPACVSDKPDGGQKTTDRLWLYLTRSIGGEDGYFAKQTERLSDAKVWKKLSDESHPDYTHYYTYKAVRFPEHRFVPINNELGTPYFITCGTPRGIVETADLANCSLVFSYKNQLLVKAGFDPQHLSEPSMVYRKANDLINTFLVSEK